MSTLNFGFGLYNHTTPCVRSAFDVATNLATENPANIGKFKLDTAAGTKLSYVYDIYSQAYDVRYDNGGSFQYYSFANGDINTVVATGQASFATSAATIVWSSVAQGQQNLYYFSTWWPWGYLPLVEFRDRSTAVAGQFNGPSISYFSASGTGMVDSTVGYTGQTELVNVNWGSVLYRDGYHFQLQASTNSSITRFKYLISVFQLPQRDDALPDYSAVPVSGQVQMMLNKTVARLALPGRDVSDTNVDHYIFHENKIPAKIMAAGDVNVAGSGTVDIPCPLPLTEFTYMDFHVRKQTDTEFWHPPFYNGISSAGNYAFTYFVDVANQKITITNSTSTAITVRYVIFADSEANYSTGGKKIFYKANDGTRDFVQIKRPGSSDVAPNLNDIIADSRLAYLPILAQGFLNWTTDFPTVITGSDLYKGERKATVAISNPSPKLKLFCKTIVVFPTLTSPRSTVNGFHRVFTDSGSGSWIGRASCESAWSNIHAAEDGVDFYMSGDNPMSIHFNGSSYDVNWPQKWNGGGFSTTGAIGLRYYVFGIPNAL